MSLASRFRTLAFAAALCLPAVVWAQDQAETEAPSEETGTADLPSAPNGIAGEFTPAKGFDLIKTRWGSLNVSGYGPSFTSL
jgi:hypothetical protein